MGQTSFWASIVICNVSYMLDNFLFAWIWGALALLILIVESASHSKSKAYAENTKEVTE